MRHSCTSRENRVKDPSPVSRAWGLASPQGGDKSRAHQKPASAKSGHDPTEGQLSGKSPENKCGKACDVRPAANTWEEPRLRHNSPRPPAGRGAWLVPCHRTWHPRVLHPTPEPRRPPAGRTNPALLPTTPSMSSRGKATVPQLVPPGRWGQLNPFTGGLLRKTWAKSTGLPCNKTLQLKRRIMTTQLAKKLCNLN